MSGYQGNDDIKPNQGGTLPNVGPIEPTGKQIGKPNLIKWLFFVLIVIYVLLSYFHAPILRKVGEYLIVEHSPRKSDLIVCLAGASVERSLAAADAYRKGFASRIFMAREELPDGYELLKERGIEYPASIDLRIKILKDLGVPGSALLINDRPAKSTIDEAEVVRGLVKEKGFRSLILITSPTHSRRAWLTYKKVLEKDSVRILVLPSQYSKFKPENWWKKRKYTREVIIEYEKLVYYALKYFL